MRTQKDIIWDIRNAIRVKAEHKREGLLESVACWEEILIGLRSELREVRGF